MSTASISAAPRTILRGVDDQSTERPPTTQMQVPTHLPHVFDFAERGPEKPQLVGGDELLSMYGSNVLGLRNKYTTHQTPLIEKVNAQGNNVIFQRVVPGDAEKATRRLYLELAENVKIPVYDRDDEGSVRLDANGDPIQKEDDEGNKVYRTGSMARWVTARVGIDRETWNPDNDYPRHTVVEHRPSEDTDPKLYRAKRYVPSKDANGEPIEPGQWKGWGENWRDYWKLIKDSSGEPLDADPRFGDAHIIGPDADTTNEDPLDTGEPWPESIPSDRVKDDTKVTIYPIMDFEVSHYGAYGDLQGLRIWAPTTTGNDEINDELARDQKTYLYRIQLVERADKESTPDVVDTLTGAPYVEFSFKEGAYDPQTGVDLDIDEQFLDSYRDLDEDPAIYGPFNRFHVYKENVETITKKLYQAEVIKRNRYTFNTWDSDEDYYGGHIVRYTPTSGDDEGRAGYYRLEADELEGSERDVNPHESDYWTRVGDVDDPFDDVFEKELDVEVDWPWEAEEGMHIFNFISGKDMDGDPYLTFQLAGPAQGGLELSKNSTIYATGGSDGTMDIDEFDSLVGEICESYGDEKWNFLDTAYWPQSVIYDSGFTLSTKEKLITPVGRRKDIGVILSTQDVQRSQNTVEEENSISGILRARARAYPESEYYGTHVCRVAIIGHSGYLINSQYRGLLPLTVEFAEKAARFMGAGNGIWARNRGFDMSPFNQIENFKDVNHPWKPRRQYHSDWEVGLNWVQNFDRRALFFPAYQTVYDNDTSVLNSIVNMFIVIEAQKVAERTWRRLTGQAKLTREEFKEKSDELILDNMQGRFDDRVVAEPETYLTDYDEKLGYSWSTDITLYLNNMMTVGTFTIVSKRRADLD